MKKSKRKFKITVADVTFQERIVEIPARCPVCDVDLRKPSALEVVELHPQAYAARLVEPLEEGTHYGLGPLDRCLEGADVARVHVMCAACEGDLAFTKETRAKA